MARDLCCRGSCRSIGELRKIETEPTSEAGKSNWKNAINVVGVFSVLLKISLIFQTLGTNDVLYWAQFSDFTRNNSIVSIYSDIWYFNHPPLMAVVIWFLGAVSGESLWLFSALLRMMSVIADFGSLWLVWALGSLLLGPIRGVLTAALFALSPVMLLVSGVHGNTDPIFMFLVFLAVYVVVFKRAYFLAGLALGLALNIKIVPLIVLPAFIFCLPSWRARFRFVLGTLWPLAVGYLLPVYLAGPDLIRNIFVYKGTSGFWGIGWFFPAWREALLPILLIAIVSLSWLSSFRPGQPSRSESGSTLVKAVNLTFLIFMVLSPASAAQYLTWLAIPMALSGPVIQVGYSLVAGLYLLSFYAHYLGTGLVPVFFHHLGENTDLAVKYAALQSEFSWTTWDQFLVLEELPLAPVLWGFLMVLMILNCSRIVYDLVFKNPESRTYVMSRLGKFLKPS
ncbi:glycosyltransferase family 39 protein [Limibacillus halophilus]|uniref:Glycosyltransferase RgtA/B/C/D-like domain-containing protein n=1 Tax=Limibacillus halophilus TaxID=1579333 RepID=A0A839SSS8_9PROT|nr:glycosyltransferase family 39 protein [Limibacillus halophilus]MBB3064770.1 hypothetical protein [Limibacillus halophilus]